MRIIGLGNQLYGVKCDQCGRIGTTTRRYGVEERTSWGVVDTVRYLCDGCVADVLRDIYLPVHLADQDPPCVERTGPGEYHVAPAQDPTSERGVPPDDGFQEEMR